MHIYYIIIVKLKQRLLNYDKYNKIMIIKYDIIISKTIV